MKVGKPDGMHIIFYEKCQNIVGKNIIRKIKDFLYYSHLLRDINQTRVVYPKKGKSGKR